MSKRESLEQQKQSLIYVSDSLQALMKEYNDKIAICNKFKDVISIYPTNFQAFSKQNVVDYVTKEVKGTEDRTADLELSAEAGSVGPDLLQVYYETRKRHHYMEIVKTKLPTLQFQ